VEARRRQEEDAAFEQLGRDCAALTASLDDAHTRLGAADAERNALAAMLEAERSRAVREVMALAEAAQAQDESRAAAHAREMSQLRSGETAAKERCFAAEARRDELAARSAEQERMLGDARQLLEDSRERIAALEHANEALKRQLYALERLPDELQLIELMLQRERSAQPPNLPRHRPAPPRPAPPRPAPPRPA
jgi:chromosome segregation ATPase